MDDIREMRELYESYRGPAERPSALGRAEFVRDFRHRLGLCDERGNDYKDGCRNRRLELREGTVRRPDGSKTNPIANVAAYDLTEMALAIVGPRVMELFGQGSKQLLAEYARHNMMTGSAITVNGQPSVDYTRLFEATGVGVDVSAFADINAWTGVTGGLIERKILEQFNNPGFIGEKLMPPEPTKVAEGQKVIGVSRIGDLTQERQPGEAHQRGTFAERYVTLGKTRENALALDLFKEAEFFDLTGQVMPTAGSVGEWVGFRREIDMIDAFIGISTQHNSGTSKYQFQYKGTAYDTYNASQTIGSFALANSQSNELVDWISVQSSWLLFVRVLDPETGTRVLIRPDIVVVNPAKLATAHMIFGAHENERRTANTQGSGTGTAQSTTGDLHILRVNGNVVSQFFGAPEVLWSPLLEQRCTDAASGIARPGLGLSQSNADKYWWVAERMKFMRWMQNWPLTLTSAPANSYEMVDRGIIASWFCNERGMPSVWGAWYGQQNTN